MNKIIGKLLNRLPFQDIWKVADLTYWDGPLLSLFIDAEGQLFIFYWCDSNDSYNRWLVFQVSDEQLAAYIRRDLTLYALITRPHDDKIFVVDIDGQGNHSSIRQTQPQKLPDDYKPKPETYYDASSTVFYEQDYAVEFITILLEKIQQLKTRKLSYKHSFYWPQQLGFYPQQLEYPKLRATMQTVESGLSLFAMQDIESNWTSYDKVPQ